ncbi:MAG: hypothetical protein IK062_06190 [Selenomonadaceae bacterium]|nr:hypothetical protein [Selenomonadaceae bacterium]
MDLSGTVVGFDDKFFDSNVTDGQTPPLHPRCRCVIVYREIDAPRGKNTLQISGTSGNMQNESRILNLTPRQQKIKFAEDTAYNTPTTSDFGFITPTIKIPKIFEKFLQI